MAKFVLGSLITNIAGSVGGTTLRRVPNGFSMYNKIKGASVSKLLQNTRVPQIANIFQRWSLLSDSERSGWNATALTVTFPDKFGVAKNLTGRQLFSKSNIQALPAGFTVNDSTGFTKDIPVFSLDDSDGGIGDDTLELVFSEIVGTVSIFISYEISNRSIYQPTFKSRKVWQFEPDLSNGNLAISASVRAAFPFVQEGMFMYVYVQGYNEFGMLSPYQFTYIQL